MKYIERIRSLREERYLNQSKVAKIINVAQTTYSDYEKGKIRIPIECLIALAQFYNVDMNYISGVSDEKRTFPSKK
ncbi:MAG: XRE family transcriptional regulator [Clostridia bacterium]|nr:XRE family transcriptional regulator [Clostridia bacterium]